MSGVFIFLGALFWVISVCGTYLLLPRDDQSRRPSILSAIRLNVVRAVHRGDEVGLRASASQLYGIYLVLAGFIIAAIGEEAIGSIPGELIVLLCAVVPAVLGTLVLDWLIRQ
jgi:hypothetical protein